MHVLPIAFFIDYKSKSQPSVQNWEKPIETLLLRIHALHVNIVLFDERKEDQNTSLDGSLLKKIF